MPSNKTQVGLAGEYFVLAQLTRLGVIATMTLSNTKGVDILITNQTLNKLFKIEVKTSTSKSSSNQLFCKDRFYLWRMGKKHEEIIDKNLYYCFVLLEDNESIPKYFIVPSKEVARYVKWEHKLWLDTRKGKVKDTEMRIFRIELKDPKKYQNNWDIFLK